jgi:hypothetical protein
MSASAIYESYEEIRTRQKYIPPDFSAHPLHETGADIPLKEGFREDQGIPEVAPLWAVHSEGKTFRTSRPIRVRIFREGDIFFAKNETLLVCGTGDSAPDAVEELELHIIHFYKYYRELPSDRVMGEAKRLKSFYENLLIEEQ